MMHTSLRAGAEPSWLRAWLRGCLQGGPNGEGITVQLSDNRVDGKLRVGEDFRHFGQFHDASTLRQLDLEGAVVIAGFHPCFSLGHTCHLEKSGDGLIQETLRGGA